MGDTESYTGVCDLCGKEADAAVEECMNVVCTKGCQREGGDIYHQECIKKYINTSSRSSTSRQPKIPYSSFGCPKGKSNKTSAAEPCKGTVLHCKRIIYKDESKITPPIPLQVINPPIERKKKKDKVKAAAAAGPSNANAAADGGGWETVGAKRPPKLPAKMPRTLHRLPSTDVTRLRPIPQAPKPDPLGRNLSKEKSAELPVGFVADDESEPKGHVQEKFKQRRVQGVGKSAKKNQKRAAKRRETGSTQMVPSMGEASSTNLSGWGEGFGSGPGSEAGGSDHNSLMGNTKFITDIDHFNRLLANQLSDTESEEEDEGLAITTDDEHDDEHDDAESSYVPDFTLREGVEWPAAVSRDDTDTGDPDGWQSVLPGGRVSAPAATSSSTTLATGNTTLQEDEAQLRAALEASAAAAATAANNAAAGTTDDADFEQQLAKALAESQRAEEERLQREKAAQAALLAQFEQTRQRQAQVKQQRYQPQQLYDTTSPALHVKGAISATPILSYSQAPQSAAATITWPPAAAATATPPAAQPINLPQYTISSPLEQQPPLFLQQQQQPQPPPLGLFQQQQQPAPPLGLFHQPQQQHQQAVGHIQLPAPIAPAVTSPLVVQQQGLAVPAATLPFLQQQLQLPQQPSPLPWQQQHQLQQQHNNVAVLAAPLALPVPSAAQKMASMTSTQRVVAEDDDTDELLALLNIS